MQGKQSQNVVGLLHYIVVSLNMLKGNSVFDIKILVSHLFLLVHVMPSTPRYSYYQVYNQDI